MEILQGISNWKLTIQRESDHIRILRALSCDSRAVLPDELFGLPVRVLADHALAAGAADRDGEKLQIVCGREQDWDNRNIGELHLPAYLSHVENYALYGCRSLHTLQLYDRVEQWGGGCLMNCGALRRVKLIRTDEKHGESLAFLCRELHDELDVSITETGGTLIRLFFPGFDEDYEENFANHHFDYSIKGGGYPYHHVFRGKQLSLHDYDSLWSKYMRHSSDSDSAIRLAYTRLRHPVGLSAESEEQYVQYLRMNTADVLRWQLTQKDTEGLAMLLSKLDPTEQDLHLTCELARRDGSTGALALLLERQHITKPTGFERSFEL